MMSENQSLSIDRVASLCGCERADIARLIELGLLSSDGLDRQDINGTRLMLSLESAGISLAVFARAVEDGTLSLEFSRHLMPDTIVLSARSYGEACAELELDVDTLTRLFIAAGLPIPDPARRAREDEVALLQLMAATLERGVSEPAMIGILRVFGQATRRMAEAMRDFFRSQVEARLADQEMSTADMMTAAAQHRVPLQNIGFQAMRLLSARFLEDMVFENITMRIQDELAVHGLLEPRGVSDPAVAFVDLAGYSALTREVGDQEAARKAGDFETLAQQSTAGSGGRIVKSLGDGLLLIFPEAGRATEGCLDLMRRLALARLPEIHVGLSVGPVIRRDGDIFGNSVNLAARLAALAAPSEIAADAASLPWLDNEAIAWQAGGVVTPKGMPEIAIYKLRVQP